LCQMKRRAGMTMHGMQTILESASKTVQCSRMLKIILEFSKFTYIYSTQ
jgi:hypothetical protein